MSMSYMDLAASSDARQWANQAAMSQYYGALANGANSSAALQQANQAFQNALSTSQLSGYFGAGVGNGTVAGQPTFPNLQYTTGAFGQYYPGGLAGVSPGTPTQAATENMQNYGLQQAGVTGVYNDPGNMTYRPGSFVRDQETGGIGQIQSNGRMQMFGSWGDFVRAGGSESVLNNPDMVRNVSTAQYNDLANNPTSNMPGGGNNGGGTATLQSQQLYGTNAVPGRDAATMAMQQLYGGYGTPQAGQQTQSMQQQQWQQGFSQSQADIARQQWEKSFAATQGQNTQQNTLAYLQQLASLRGPADWAKYQQVLGSTPNGMRDMYAAAMGQYTPGGGATTGVAPQAANLQTMQQQIGGGGYGGGTDYTGAYGNQQYAQGDYRNGAMPNGGNTGQAGGQWQAQNMGGDNYAQPQYQQGGQTWGSGIGVGTQAPTAAQQQQAQGGGANMYGGMQNPQQQYTLPAPNQIAAQSWNNMAPSQQQMMLGMYESNGWDKNDVTALYNQSLPKYGTNNASAGTWRMQ